MAWAVTVTIKRALINLLEICCDCLSSADIFQTYIKKKKKKKIRNQTAWIQVKSDIVSCQFWSTDDARKQRFDKFSFLLAETHVASSRRMLMGFKNATPTSCYIFQKTVDFKLPLLRWCYHEVASSVNTYVLIVQLNSKTLLLRKVLANKTFLK